MLRGRSHVKLQMKEIFHHPTCSKRRVEVDADFVGMKKNFPDLRACLISCPSSPITRLSSNRKGGKSERRTIFIEYDAPLSR